MIRTLIVAIAIALASCTAEPVSTQSTDNPTIPIAHLLTIDGCKVYRFHDAGKARYLTTCPRASVSQSDSEPCGKGCTRQAPEEIQTVEVAR